MESATTLMPPFTGLSGIIVIIANIAGPDVMPRNVVFHLGIYCLSTFPFYKWLKRTATLMITTLYIKDLNKP